MEKETISRPLQKLYPLQTWPERENDKPPLDTNNVEIEESKSLIDLDSAGSDLCGSDAAGRTKIQQAAAINGDMKQR